MTVDEFAATQAPLEVGSSLHPSWLSENDSHRMVGRAKAVRRMFSTVFEPRWSLFF